MRRPWPTGGGEGAVAPKTKRNTHKLTIIIVRTHFKVESKEESGACQFVILQLLPLKVCNIKMFVHAIYKIYKLNIFFQN